MKRRIDKAIGKLIGDPYLGKLLRGELSGLRSLKVGDYRVIYSIDEGERTIILYTVKHRKSVYK